MQEVPWLSDKEQELWRALLHAKTSIDRAIDVRLQNTADISTADFSVLVSLSEAEQHTLRMRQLCELLNWDRSRMSHQITRMEKRGLVKKLMCSADKRGINVELTERGIEVIQNAAPDHVCLVRSLLFDVIGDADFDKILPVLKAVSDKAEAEINGDI